MKKRSDKNSATSAVAGFTGVIDDAILPPAGVELRSDKEHLIWNQFTRARSKEDWRDRSRWLDQTAHDPRTIDGTAKVESDARAALKDVGVGALIAQPMN